MRIFKILFNHKKLYLLGLILVTITLPLSKFALSVSMIFLISNWAIELEFRRKWNVLKENKSIIIFVGIFLIHLIWLINTENFLYGFKDIGNKVILVLFPLVIGTSLKIDSKELKQILLWFSVSVVVSTLISTSILIGLIELHINTIRDISPFMSHIRLSLLINTSIFSLGYMWISKRFSLNQFEKAIIPILMIWLIIFLYLLKSWTGIVIFLVLAILILGFVSTKIKDVVPRLFLQVSLITILLLIASFTTHSISKFYSKEKVDFQNLEKFTKQGNEYVHIVENKQIENGKYVWIYLCEKELSKEWDKRSSHKYVDNDTKGQMLKITLIRYLTSKGLRKDSLGISKLNNDDIKNIESGMANYIYKDKYAIYPKVYQAIWEFDVYKKGNNPAGNSITQRIEYLKTASNIIQNNFWLGVGTGDVKDEFNKQYELNKSQLPQKKRLRAHNQYVTFLLTFGIFGFLYVVFAIIYPVYSLKAYRSYLVVIFLIIALLSFINEDTLESQIGVTFFSYFYSLFLFGNNLINKKEEENV